MLSGTHSSNFFDFCDGHHEIYHMRRHLDAKPDLVSTVVADLPDEVFTESSDKLPRQSAHQQNIDKRGKVRLWKQSMSYAQAA